MKPVHSLPAAFALLAALTLSSCSVARRVHTARSVTIGCEVTQMPTVAELDVAPQPARADTAWVNHLFKGSVPVRSQEQALVARILSEADADVLVEPKVSRKARRHWFRTDNMLTVSGYPARYKAFRTATTEDLEKIRTLRSPQVPPPPVKEVETRSCARPVPQAPVVLAKPAKASEPVRERRYRRKTGYRGFLDGGYYMGNDLDDGYGFSTTHGYQISQHFFAGIGAGYYKLAKNDPDDYDSSEQIIPVFAQVRSYILKNRVSPYVDLRGGYALYDPDSYFVGAGAGVSVGRFDLGFEYARIGDVDDTFRLRIGISF